MWRVAAGTLVALALAGAVALRMHHAAPPAPAAEDPLGLLPSSGLYSDADVGHGFTWVHIMPFGKRGRAFQLLLPADWEWRQAQVPPERLNQEDSEPVPLAEMGPRSDEDALLEVRSVRVPAHVALSRFLQVYAERSGHRVVAEQDGRFGPAHREVHDALLRKTTARFGPALTRLTVSRRGDVVFLVAGSAPAADFARWKRVFGVAAVSFTPDPG